MCGILGYLSKDTLKSSEIKLMLDAMNHRGPDGRGIKIFNPTHETHLYFGHVRLSILDLSDLGSQPMVYMNRYWITFNGEIYNFKELREELKLKGYSFTSDTDTEVLLAAYKEWNHRCLSKLNGMFAFSIYDIESKEIFIARDRFGIKPLYFFYSDEIFAFASEIKSLMANKKIRESVTPDIVECKNYLKKGPQVWRNKTLFSNIRRFPKASFFQGSIEDLIKKGFKTTKYYEIPFNSKVKKLPDDELVSEFRSLFSSSVRLRLRADVNIGTALSGGLDSSSITYFINKELSKKNNSQKQKTFSSIYTKEDFRKYDESQYIDKVAKYLNVDSYKVEIKSKDVLESYEKLIWAHDYPPEGMPIQGWLTYKLVKDNGCTISLDGQGADEQLAGYETFLINYLSHMKLRRFISEIKKIYKFPYSFFQIFMISFFFISNRLKLSKLFTFLLKIFFGSSFDPTNRLNEILYRTFDENLMTLLFHGDKQSMAWSVETRLPYMDFRLVEFLANLPNDLKIRDGWTKYINRKALESRIPDEIVWRKNKLGWPVPEKEWLEGDLKLWSTQIINESSFLKKVIKNDLKIYLNRNKTKFIVRKLNLAIWHKLFFDKNYELLQESNNFNNL